MHHLLSVFRKTTTSAIALPGSVTILADEKIKVIKRAKAKYALLLASGILLSACSSLPGQQSVVVDGYKMAYAAQGEGSPVVVLESGFGTTMENWSQVFSGVSQFSTVFAYNRRGYEGSNHREGVAETSTIKDIAMTAGELALDAVAPGVSLAVDVVTTANSAANMAARAKRPDSRTADQVVEDLRAMLAEAGMKPPYVLVGHSLGGLYTLYYAKTYPQEVLGVVLVDSSHPEQLQRCRARYSDDACDAPTLVKFITKMFPDEMLAEFNGMEETGYQVMAAGPLRPMPLVVLTHGKDSGMGSGPVAVMWPELQLDLAAELPDSTHIIAPESGHFIQKDQPELVIDAIKQIVDTVRNSKIAAK